MGDMKMNDEIVKNNRILPWTLLILAVLFTVIRTVNNVMIVTSPESGILNYLPVVFLIICAVFVITGIVTACINKVHDPATERVNSIERAFIILAVLTTVVPYIFRRLIVSSEVLFDLYTEHSVTFSFIMTIVTMYIIGFPALALSARPVPKMKIEERKLGFVNFLMYVCIVAGMCLTGSLIGTPIHMILTLPFQGNPNAGITEMMLNSSFFERVLTVGVLAPIFEELMFRKILIDRTIKYGEFISILLSGVMFGLFHGNFQQFFFAALAGAMFAFIYIRTGRIRYTIFLHMAVNMSSSIVTTSLLSKIYPVVMDSEVMESGNYDAQTLLLLLILTGWLMLLGLIAVTGIVLFFVFNKRLKIYRAPDEPSRGAIMAQVSSSPVFWGFVVLCLSDFLSTYLPDIVYSLI